MMLFLKIFSIRNFQGFVVYCLIIKVLCCFCCRSLSSAATFIEYHVRCSLSRTFLFFFSASGSQLFPVTHTTALIAYHITLLFVKHFSTFFNLICQLIEPLHNSCLAQKLPLCQSRLQQVCHPRWNLILSFQFVIVNNFLVFYFIHTFQTIYC